MKDLIFEEFPNMHTMVEELASRPHNTIMKYENASVTEPKSFTGTSCYKEAESLAKYGYKEILNSLKDSTRINSNKLNKILLPTRKAIPKNMVVGCIPNVPNAILGRPDSMINIIKIPQKVKVMEIIYILSANCCTPKELFERAGPILLSALQFIEKRGIRVKLSVCFYFGECGCENAIGLVKIKDYGERLDLQRVSFPIAHPSILRRLGFRWLETVPNLSDRNWTSGYGRQLVGEKYLGDFIKLPKNSYVISAQDIESMGFDTIKLLNFLNLK